MARAQTHPAIDPEPGLAHRGPGQLVLIAGGGIAGLSAALALARRGVASHVLEKRAAFAEDGAGIQIGPNGTRILAELGVADVLEPLVARPDALRVMDGRSGLELTRMPLGRWMESRHGAPYWTAHRADLHAALMKSVRASPLVRLSMGAELAAIEDTGASVTLKAAHAGSWQGDALVAADGLWSMFRNAVSPGNGEPQFAGRSALRAVVPASALPAELEHNAVHLWQSPGAHVVHYPVRGGAEISIVLIVQDSEASTSWSTDVLPAWIPAHAPRFSEPLAELLAQPRAWRKWSLHALPGGIARRWVKGRVALIGDAAHPVLPFLAQGGVLALEDSSVLARCIADRRDDVPAALRMFEQQRWRRAARVARASQRNGRVYHLGGMLATARDAVLTRAPGERLIAGYDWMYGWKAT